SIRPNPNANNVSPAPAKGESYRWHWDTPMIFSPNDPGTLIVAANKVFVSHDRGDSWTAISPDLTTNASRDTIVTMGVKGSDIHLSRDDGVSQWPAIVALAESPKQAGVYYSGTDDGTVSVSRDGGKTWQRITANLPGFPSGGFVSRITPSRYDAATVYVTVDNHRLNDYAPYMWVSTDFGATFHSIVNNLRDQNVRTLTEDQRNRDVLYIGTETGIFLSLDRGHSWQRLKANLPTVRVDEITLHPRDNAMLVATHGRALWVLDHLEPIQEYQSAHAAAGDARLFTLPTALEWKTKDDRNHEFWGHQYFVGENPPNEAVVQFLLTGPVNGIKLRVSDAHGKVIRESAIPAARNVAGIQTACWDFRTEPIPPPPSDSTAGGRGGRGGAGGGRGGRGGPPAVPGVPGPLPTAYTALNPCATTTDSAIGRGGGGGFGGGLGGPGPYVVPGTYSVSLVSNGKILDSKPLAVMPDPDMHFAPGEHVRYNATVTDLHEMQRRATAAAIALNALYPQMAGVSAKIDQTASVPAALKAQFASLSAELDTIRHKFGVPLVAAAGGRGGGGGRGAAPVDPENVLARASTLKNSIMSVWETPSPALVRRYGQVKSELPKAVTAATRVLSRAAAVSQQLEHYDITLTVPSLPPP
ncbi:MAG TPA: hypothetical protein VII52_16665, partial [Gemmatimonadaceae bacterium]